MTTELQKHVQKLRSVLHNVMLMFRVLSSNHGAFPRGGQERVRRKGLYFRAKIAGFLQALRLIVAQTIF